MKRTIHPVEILRHSAAWLIVAVVLAVPVARGDDSGLRRARLLNRGAEVYEQQCAGCHGVEGSGEGEAASMLYPRPRDFTSGEFKFSSRPTPDLPTDADLKQVIREGLRGTSMKGFPFIPEHEVEAVIAYIKTFSERWTDPQSPPIVLPEDPWAGREAEGIEKGLEVYHVEAVCISCHPSFLDTSEIEAVSERLGYAAIPLRDDAHLSVGREAADGSLIYPPDFKRDRIKTGNNLENLYRVISAGITTTAMPTWDGILEPEQLWGLAHYVRWVSEQRPDRVDPETYALRPQVDPSLPPVSVADDEETMEFSIP